MALTFHTERLWAVADDIEPLLQLHYDEIALHKEAIPLDPDWNRYACLDERGELAIYTARDDGNLVGYGVFFVHDHPHYASTLVAANDLLFLHPDYRRGGLGLRLIRYCEQQLKARGVVKLTWHIKFAHDWSAILHRQGYLDEEKIVGKIL
jgi:GNAT superfamily N-acetyltransferase